MALTVKHAFVSSIVDDPAALTAGDICPQTHWNAAHALSGTFTGADIGFFNSGTNASGSTFWRGDGTWATAGISGSGVSGQIAYWNGTSAVTGDTGLTYAGSGGALTLNSNGILTAPAAATWQFGAADAASPVAQTLQVQSVAAGNSNTAGADWTIVGSKSTGSALSGNVIFKVGSLGGSGTSQNGSVELLRLAPVFGGGRGTVSVNGPSVNTFDGFVGNRPIFQVQAFDFEAAIGIINWGGGGSGPATLHLARSRGISAGSYVSLSNGDFVGYVAFEGVGVSGASGGFFNSGSYVYGYVDGIPIANLPTRLSFWTSNDSSPNPIERTRIDANGHMVFTANGDIGGSFTPLTTATTCTISIASPAVITLTAHGFVPGQQVSFTTTGSLPTGIVSGTAYYVIAAGLAANTFEIAATAGGAAINTSGSQSGTQTCTGSNANAFASTLVTLGPSGLTGSLTTAGVTIAQTWNTTGVVDAALKVNVTNIASAAGSALLDIQQGGVSQLILYNKVGSTASPILAVGAGGSGLEIFNVVDTINNPTNYERAVMEYRSNVLNIGSESGGTGTTREIAFLNPAMICQTDSTHVSWYWSYAGNHFFSITQAQPTLGANGTLLSGPNNQAEQNYFNQDAGFSRATAKVWQFGDGSSNPGNNHGWMNWAGEQRTTGTTTYTSNTTLSTILTANLQAGRTYFFDIYVPFTAGGNAGGVKLALAGTATVTNMIADGWLVSSNAIAGQAQVTSLTTVVAATAGAATGCVRVQGTITVNAAGTFLVQTAQNASNATSLVIGQGARLFMNDAP